MKICRLCGSNPAIKRSHIIPAFVYSAIKKASATGYLRQDKSPNKRVQDSDKHPLLCTDCEQRFGKREKKFNDYIFKDFIKLNQFNFKYGDWLHYFITSVAWRILIMDIASGGVPEKVLSELKVAENMMRNYLLGKDNLADLINNHLILFPADAKSNDSALSTAIPMIRRGTLGYTLWKDNRFSSVIVNLAGVLCVTHIHLDQKDIWHNTKVHPVGGRLEHPQDIDSWICVDFFKRVTECYENMLNLSEKQLAIIKNAIRVNN
jgi:hypothetical protein